MYMAYQFLFLFPEVGNFLEISSKYRQYVTSNEFRTIAKFYDSYKIDFRDKKY